jgi:hypothetical protein
MFLPQPLKHARSGRPEKPVPMLKSTFRDAIVNENPDLAALDKLKTRIQGLRAKTTDNGCTEGEASVSRRQGRRAARSPRPVADRCRNP